jgi:hypothetical protein
MSELLNRLKEEHSEMFKIMKQAKDLCVTTKDGQGLLMNSKELMLLHIDKEDVEFYPALRKAVENNERLRNLLVQFDEEMMEVFEVAYDFFERYAEGCSEMDFIHDFGILFIMPKERMAKEENVLFHEFEWPAV